MNRLFVLLPLLLVAAGCQQAPKNADPSVITARDADWQEAMNSGDIDALADIYADDARLMPPNAPASISGDALRETFSDMMQSGVKIYLTSVEAQVSGDVAYSVGTYQVKSDDDVVDTGKYVEILKHRSDGQWRITNDIWNSDMPAAMASNEGTRIMLTHEVKDGAHWLDAWRGEDGRRKLFAENGLTDVHTFQSVDDPNLMGLEFTGKMEDFQSMMDDPDSQAAAQEDGVELDSLKLFKEAE